MGSHYGVKIRQLERKVLAQQRQNYACPSCGKKSLYRKGSAQWECSSCGTKMAGGSYLPETEVGVSARKTLSSVKP